MCLILGIMLSVLPFLIFICIDLANNGPPDFDADDYSLQILNSVSQIIVSIVFAQQLKWSIIAFKTYQRHKKQFSNNISENFYVSLSIHIRDDTTMNEGTNAPRRSSGIFSAKDKSQGSRPRTLMTKHEGSVSSSIGLRSSGDDFSINTHSSKKEEDKKQALNTKMSLPS